MHHGTFTHTLATAPSSQVGVDHRHHQHPRCKARILRVAGHTLCSSAAHGIQLRPWLGASGLVGSTRSPRCGPPCRPWWWSRPSCPSLRDGGAGSGGAGGGSGQQMFLFISLHVAGAAAATPSRTTGARLGGSCWVCKAPRTGPARMWGMFGRDHVQGHEQAKGPRPLLVQV